MVRIKQSRKIMTINAFKERTLNECLEINYLKRNGTNKVTELCNGLIISASSELLPYAK